MNLQFFQEKFKERVISLDIETTGGAKDKNKIIQLGVVEYNNGEYVREHVRMFGGGRSLPICIGIHHITDSMRDGLPDFDSCCDKIAKYLSNSIIIGHNVVACDMRMINEAMDRTGNKIENYTLIDTYRLAKKILPLKKFNLELCCSELGLEFGEHDALGDAKSALMVFDQIIRRRNGFDKEFFFV